MKNNKSIASSFTNPALIIDNLLFTTKMTETNRIELKQQLTDSLEKEVIAFLNFTGIDISLNIMNN